MEENRKDRLRLTSREWDHFAIDQSDHRDRVNGEGLAV